MVMVAEAGIITYDPGPTIKWTGFGGTYKTTEPAVLVALEQGEAILDEMLGDLFIEDEERAAKYQSLPLLVKAIVIAGSYITPL